MFSGEEEKLNKLLELENSYIQRVNRNVEKLTKQIELLESIKNQIGGANKSKTPTKSGDKSSSTTKTTTPTGSAAKTTTPTGSAAKTTTPTDSKSSPVKASDSEKEKEVKEKEEEEVKEKEEEVNLINLRGNQVNDAITKAELEIAKKNLEDGTGKKLAKLKEVITNYLGKDDISELVNQILDIIKKLEIPSIKQFDKETQEKINKLATSLALKEISKEEFDSEIKKLKEVQDKEVKIKKEERE